MFAGIAQTRYFKIINADGTAVDLTSLTGDVTWTATGAAGNYTIGPKICVVESAVDGECSCNLTALETMHVDLYSISVAIGAPISRTSYLQDLWIVGVQPARTVPVVSGQAFTLDIVLKDNAGSVIDLTAITPVFYTKAEQNATGFVAGSVVVTDAVNGTVQVTHTLTSDVWGYFVADTIISSDVKISVQ